MVRPYSVKGRKRKKREENYDKEDIEQIGEEETMDAIRKEEIEDAPDEEKEAENLPELAGIPIQPYDQKTQSGAIFILEKASLEVAKVGKNYQLLNSDDHANFLRRNNKNPADYRPDIAHQAILAILDSPLNKAGRLRALYVKTEKGVLFEVKPHVRIPRTYKRFSGIILQLLQKLSITAVGKSEKLLRVIKNPVTQYLPVISRKIGFSFSSEKLVDIRDYIAAVSDDVNFVFVVCLKAT
ncbi:nucleolar essential protein-like protein [Actinidia rufa]|uniref:Nucleolar essential protein-like protein n=1 Tax=Actinidia rufa TaxID=165716 RepID=A0A7J0DGJ5_9ERIC|nr:nucleolar essential protein-like protein [Actinidia rufa]